MVRKPLTTDRSTPALFALASSFRNARAASVRMYFPLPTGVTVMRCGTPLMYPSVRFFVVTCLSSAAVRAVRAPVCARP